MPPRLRTLLILGRVSNLPTVWSNCLAGWWLGGSGNFGKLPLLLVGVSALYTGGMFLNDAFDADFDQRRRRERPVPSGAIPLSSVWYWGWAWLALGLLCLTLVGKITGALAVVLAVCIVLYNAAHKAIPGGPWLMGVCRMFVYVIGGSTSVWGLSGWPIWGGMALGIYVAGLSYVAQRESFRKRIPYWPLALLAAPVALAAIMDTDQGRMPGIWLSLVLVLWVAYCTRTIFQPIEVNVARMVSGLLAGIIWVDWLAVAPGCPPWLSYIFLLLFAQTLVLQRYVPAT
ncbi:MAG TPA: UbiA family prenyltransferase [Verrucomicrobiae bacterium]|nr:UbiA family prenyltransferase [Verrucomicrobiae bacterium]